jgi:dihydroorotate dehydrogenase (NAD+) catalytic subunit
LTETLTETATTGRLATRVGPLELRNPVLPASGCFGPELRSVVPVDRLGGVVTKTVFSDIRSGNPAHRLAETRDGMLNSVGIPSIGARRWRTEVLPDYLACGAPVIVSLGGLAERDYARAAADLEGAPVAAYELNLSCPNLEAGGVELGADPAALTRAVAGVRAVTSVPLLVKLTPNVASIADLARAAVDGGADAVVVANTFVGMAIDLHRRRPVLGNGIGGWSGPAAKPLILRMVWQVARAVDVPIVGCGGAADAYDVAEYLVAGASAVEVGTATFTRPQAMTEIVAELPDVLDELGASGVTDLIGTLTHP